MLFGKIRRNLRLFDENKYRWSLAAACLDRYVFTSTKAWLRNFAKVHISYYVIAKIIGILAVISVILLVFDNLKDGVCGILLAYFYCYHWKIFPFLIMLADMNS